MSDNTRFYKWQNVKSLEELNSESAFILIDQGNWKRPGTLSLQQIGDVLKIEIKDNILSQVVKNVDIYDIESQPIPPRKDMTLQETFITNDENFLYVWIPQSEKWKRIPLSEWY